ncbi:MAG: DAK2 domain-containing protein [Bacillota bacterium]|jgi:DAK2 domain fusion protein YloV
MAGAKHDRAPVKSGLDGHGLIDAFASGVAWLGENKSMVDSLNVFPVPDGDTGTNMYLTVSAALKEAQKSPTSNVGAAADAIAIGSLMGARGNSGVILSQLVRGFAKRLHGLAVASPSDVGAAFLEAANVAYKAVMKPVEGTILTVARMGARAAVQAARDGRDVQGVFDEAIRQGEITLSKTPDMLPALKEAGVVDAGGKGLVVFMQGFAMGLRGEAVSARPQAQAPVDVRPGLRPVQEEIRFRYCTEFIIRGDRLNPDSVRSSILSAAEGDSVLVVGNETMVKVHIHTNSPGRVLDTCIAHGSLHEIDIDNMEDQHEEFESIGESLKPAAANQALTPASVKDVGVIAVAAGDGVEKILMSLGADFVVTGGQTMNPSIQDIADAVQAAHAREVIVLPNNGNVVLTARKASEVPDLVDIKMHVVPSKTIPQGLAALLAMSPSAPVGENIERMSEAIKRVKTGEITYAVRDSAANGLDIREHDIIGLFDGDLKAVGQDISEVASSLFAQMHSAEDEIATILYGAGVDREKAEDLASSLRDRYPDVEFEVQYGGQPLYYYLISVE